jgi:hypothetical protein
VSVPGEDEIDPLANEDGDRDFRARVKELELLVLLGGYVDGGRDLLARHRVGGALLSLAGLLYTTCTYVWIKQGGATQLLF